MSPSLLCGTSGANIGDSITYGYGLTDRDSSSFPVVLGTLLDSSGGAEYRIYNRGKNSRTMGGMNYPYTREQEWTDARADCSDIYTIGP